MIHNCIKCGDPLIVGKNITQCVLDHYQYVCRTCQRERDQKYQQEHREHIRDYHRKYNQDHREQNRNRVREYTHRTGQNRPMSENRCCSSFLGVHVAERVLSHVFENVQKMPYGNPGFDFICGGGHKIDVKSACRYVSEKRADRWAFTIKKNKIAEYFLMLAFDDRNNLNPEHIWLIPSDKISDHANIGISENMLSKWNEYALDVSKVSACCNIIKEVI